MSAAFAKQARSSVIHAVTIDGKPSLKAVSRAGKSAQTFQALYSQADCARASPHKAPATRQIKVKVKRQKVKLRGETTFRLKEVLRLTFSFCLFTFTFTMFPKPRLLQDIIPESVS
jgi:hypothetical protein